MTVYQERNFSRAYVSLFGQTIVDKETDSCDPKPLEPFKYSANVPMIDFNIWLVHVGLGVRFSGEMAFNHRQTGCVMGRHQPSQGVDEILIQPQAQLRVAGEASGTALVIRGGIDIGADFNYQSGLRFRAEPGFCLSASDGHKPMSVSVQPWFQVKHLIHN